MYWTLELASSLDDAPWPATKEELIDYATRRTWKNWKTTARSTNPSKISGPITPRRTISSLTRKNIKPIIV